MLVSQGLKADCPSSLSGFSLWPEKEGLGIGSCLWHVIDCVLREFLLLFYFSNLMKGAILSWWKSICIWTVGCSSSVTQGVPEETRLPESIWSGKEHHAQAQICVGQQTAGVSSSNSERLLNHLSRYCNVTIIVLNGFLLPRATNLNSSIWHQDPHLLAFSNPPNNSTSFTGSEFMIVTWAHHVVFCCHAFILFTFQNSIQVLWTFKKMKKILT